MHSQPHLMLSSPSDSAALAHSIERLAANPALRTRRELGGQKCDDTLSYLSMDKTILPIHESALSQCR
jgi:hypothetical protein